LIEQGLTSTLDIILETVFHRSDDPTNSVKAVKEGG